MVASVKTIRKGKLGKHELRLVRKDQHFYGLVDGQKCVDGSDADDVWRRLHDDAGKNDPKYFGYPGARSRFLKIFHDGFYSDRFLSKERDQKIKAKKKLDTTVPLNKALTGGGFGEAILSVFQATEMLFPVEKAKIADMLREQDADAFVQAAAKFTSEPTESTLFKLGQVLRPYECNYWTIVTYLPFLWNPETHMYLKPGVTQDFAERVGHPFKSLYDSQLEFDVYKSLLDLANKTSN